MLVEKIDIAKRIDADTSKPVNSRKVVVIGSGPVGMRFVDEVYKIYPNLSIHMFGNEPTAPYNRVQLTALLAGQIKREQIDIPLPDLQVHPGFEFTVASIENIDREHKRIRDSLGGYHHYDELVIATGARAHVPSIPGIEKQGVYTFRKLADTEALFARITRCRHVVVLGGGLLGIEAAKALSRSGTKVTLIQQGERLMNRQLDDKAADFLESDVRNMGIDVVTQSGVREVLGGDQVTGVKTRAGVVVDCDTVVVCAGIVANKELALKAQLPVAKGILVDDQMRTTDKSIFAVGECCEHRGQLYGLAQPGYEQAAVAANVICQIPAIYYGSQAVSRLKVVGKNVCSMGDVTEEQLQPFQSEWVYCRTKDQQYRKIVLQKGKLQGALSYGEWQESSRVQRAYQSNDYVWPWQRLLFSLTGKLWINDDSSRVSQWPDKTIVCQCKQITKGEIETTKLTVGNSCTVADIQKSCGASTVCGTCIPLVAELVDVEAPIAKEVAWSGLLSASLLAMLVVALMAFIPEAQVSNSVMTQGWFESIWNDKFWKQVTGFSLLGMTLVGLLMSLRKRMQFEWMGKFAYWRAVHAILGGLCIATLIFHTGFHLGSNLNQWLMIDFLALITLGGLAGAVISLSHHLSPQKAISLRKFWSWTHILVSWPLPALLTIHVLSVYYF